MEMKNAFVAGLPRSTQVNSLMFYELYLILYTVVWKLLYTVGTESIQTPLNFSLFVILQPFAKII